MKTTVWMAAAAAAAMATTGCEYTVPVSETPAGDAASALVGAWARTHNPAERLVVLPVGSREWMVCFPAESRDAMFARAWPVRAADMNLVQLQWLGTARGQLPEDGKAYQLAEFTIEADILSVRMVNGVGSASTTSKELAGQLEAGKNRPDFFREALVFQRAKD